MMLRKKNKGQSAVEYTALIIILVGAFLAIQNYMKRGVQGRWKAHVDELGQQYDPRTANTTLRQTLASQTNTEIISMNTGGGYWTRRRDTTISTETKTGTESVGAY